MSSPPQSNSPINLSSTSPTIIFSTLLTKASTMKISLCAKFTLRLLCFVIVLVLSSLTIQRLCLMTDQIKYKVDLQAQATLNRSLVEIERMAALLPPLNSTALHLTRLLSSYLNGTELTFSSIKAQVAPTLFLALSAIPHLSQVSFIDVQGLLFSYHGDSDGTYATYSNTSSPKYWQTQPVNRDTGQLYGDSLLSQPIISVNDSWVKESLNYTDGHTELGNAWTLGQELLIHYIAPMDGRGLVVLAAPAKFVQHYFASLDFQGGDFFLASVDGKVIIQTELVDTQIVLGNGTASVQTLKPNGDIRSQVGDIPCVADDGETQFHNGKIDGVEYTFHCSNIEIMGVKSVYMFSYPSPDLASLVHKNRKIFLVLLVLVFVFMVISFAAFILLLVRAARTEMCLCASIVKQKEATIQAERKSMNKTQAFANASHDVRASLAAIAGLIEFCQEDVHPDSRLGQNLVKIDKCTKDLVGILNTVLDTSKIEAGKIQLEDEDFNLAELLEDVVNLFYPLGMRKGIDVLLDPCDGSLHRTTLVRGDRGRLKQVLCNLLNNAVKFTSEGHVAIRAMVRKSSFQNTIIARNKKCLSWLSFKNKGSSEDLDVLRMVEQDPNRLEFVFEVDDTGKGIPKEKQKAIFEYFVQVKESTPGQEGCGLGLGIVESLVRLMGGEIEILDKAGERGTCFRFNIFLHACQPITADLDQECELPAPFGRWPPSQGGSHVILIIDGDERRQTLKKYIRSLNIRVTPVKPEYFLQKFENILYRLDSCNNVPMLVSDSSASEGSLNSKDENDLSLPSFRKTNSKRSSGIVLLVVDVSVGLFSELHSAVASMRKGSQSSRFKVVWLDNPLVRNSHLEIAEDDKEASDYLVYKPFHGSCLMEVLNLLPERGSPSPSKLRKLKMLRMGDGILDPQEANVSKGKGVIFVKSELDIREASGDAFTGITVVDDSDAPSKIYDQPLTGKRVLVVDDTDVMRQMTVCRIRRLGATVEVCMNGKEALDEITRALRASKEEGHSKHLPYDFVLMDVEMPILNGYEATRMIRKEEEKYGIHTLIIALTATGDAHAKQSYLAGMDFHLPKPLQTQKLLDFLQSVDSEVRSATD